MLTTVDGVKLAGIYRGWLSVVREETPELRDNLFTFIAFLKSENLLNEEAVRALIGEIEKVDE